MAFMAPLAIPLMIGSSAIGAVGAIRAGNQQAAADRYNASVATSEGNSQAAIDKSQAEVKVGQVAASYAGAGVDVNAGTPLSMMANTAANGELTRQLDLYRAQTASQIDTYEASQAQQTGYINAFGDLAGGAAKVGYLQSIQTGGNAGAGSFGF
jgi:hypothetical protein